MKNTVLVIAGTALLFLGFQNCSNVDFSSTSPASKGTSLSEPIETEEGFLPEEPDESSLEILPNEEISEGGIAKCGLDLEELFASPTSTEVVPVLNLTGTRGNGVYSYPIENVNLSDVKGNFNFSDVVSFKAHKFSGNLRVNAHGIDSLTQTQGNLLINSSQITDLTGHRGNSCIGADTIQAINDYRGNLIIFNAHISVINNFRGNLVLINSKVDLISNRIGNLNKISSDVLLETL